VREQTETADIQALADAEALVTAHGARTSHAAVVARQLGKVCLVGCEGLSIGGSLRRGTFGGVEIEEGETITVDGTTGLVFRGEIAAKKVKPKKLVEEVQRWRKAGTKR
jgi:pyruvate,orthophosphate dikinase